MAKKKTIPKTLKKITDNVVEKIVSTNPKEDFIRHYEKYKETIPEEFNKLNYIPFLVRDDLNIFFEMSNRSDGKTTTLLAFLLEESIRNEYVKISFIVRHFQLKRATKENIMDIMLMFPDVFDTSLLMFTEVEDYTKVWYNGVTIAVIFDLNNASDLKNYSSYLRKFPLAVFDEFLTLPNDYASHEAEKLDLIYSTLDKNFDNPLFNHPKIILLTNPVNFDSEILASLDIFNILETMEINTYQIYRNCFIEILRNDKVNKLKSTGIYPSKVNSGNLTGEFNFNRYNLINNFDILKEQYSNNLFKIKIDDTTSMSVIKMDNKFYVKIDFTDNDENYCLNKKDESKKCIYLKDNYYSQVFENKYNKNKIYFANNYSKNYVYDNKLTSINLNKCYNKLCKLSKDKKQNNLVDNQFKIVQKENIMKRFSFYD